ncbi:MAG: hypothetical protein ACI90G_002196, partial [Urechidicola sp.]
ALFASPFAKVLGLNYPHAAPLFTDSNYSA